LSAHPGQAKAEVNSRGTDETDADGLRLSDRIQTLLFGRSIYEGNDHD
jgi:hypothetical protein